MSYKSTWNIKSRAIPISAPASVLQNIQLLSYSWAWIEYTESLYITSSSAMPFDCFRFKTSIQSGTLIVILLAPCCVWMEYEESLCRYQALCDGISPFSSINIREATWDFREKRLPAAYGVCGRSRFQQRSMISKCLISSLVRIREGFRSGWDLTLKPHKRNPQNLVFFWISWNNTTTKEKHVFRRNDCSLIDHSWFRIIISLINWCSCRCCGDGSTYAAFVWHLTWRTAWNSSTHCCN